MTKYLTVDQAADLLTLSPQTLNNWRVKGLGPTFNKFGKRVVYSEDDVIAWAESKKTSNTQQKQSR